MVMCPYRHRLRLVDMALSTPASRIPRWRSNLWNAYLISVQGTPVFNKDTVIQLISTTHQQGQFKLSLVFATDNSYGVHPQEGIPQLYCDQLNVIAQHLQQPTIHTLQSTDSIQTESTQPPETASTPDPDRGKFFKLKELKQRSEWEEWHQSNFKMLDQYQNQGMFSAPQALPKAANALHMLWTYFLKLCGTRKSRMGCNGSPRQKGTLTLGHTYANALDAASIHLFWSIVADERLIAKGADVSNAFAEVFHQKHR